MKEEQILYMLDNYTKLQDFICYNYGDSSQENLSKNLQSLFVPDDNKRSYDRIKSYYYKNNLAKLENNEHDYFSYLISLSGSKNKLGKALKNGIIEYLTEYLFCGYYDGEFDCFVYKSAEYNHNLKKSIQPYFLEKLVVNLLVEIYSLDVLEPYFLNDSNFLEQFDDEDKVIVKNIVDSIDIYNKERKKNKVIPSRIISDIANDIAKLAEKYDRVYNCMEQLDYIYRLTCVDSNYYGCYQQLNTSLESVKKKVRK